MKINIEDYLHALDTAFKQKTPKDIYMIYVMIVAGVFGISYSLFWDSSFNEFESTRNAITQYGKKIDDNTKFLKFNPTSKIVALDKEIKLLKDEMVIHKDNNNYIKRKIETISSLIYDKRTWGQYLDSISKNAQKYNVKIKDFSNKYATQGSSFGHILDINIHATGNYKNTLKFINSIEQSDLVVDIHDLDIKAQKTLNTDLNISVWGITY